MTRKKHKPQRTCIACRETQQKRSLIRIVRTPEGQVKVDPTGKANGRGAYLCQQQTCWEKGLQQKFLAYTLKTTLSAEDLAGLQTYRQTELLKD
jgi:predicted RNA-binding protein YlxR (DUF448 family)